MRPGPFSVEEPRVDNSRCAFAPAPYNEDSMTPNPQRDSDTLRNDSEDLRKVPQSSEAFRSVPNDAEARESYTLTVREVARMFEDAGVARTERSVTNWCRKDASGSSRLNCRYDHNERKYFITPESVERAIQEELGKLQSAGRQESESGARSTKEAKSDPEEVERLRQRDRKSTRLNSSHRFLSRMPSSA